MAKISTTGAGSKQDLAVYSDPAFAQVLETWGEGTVWLEIQMLLAGRKGKVLDVACGTGRTNDFLKKFTELEYNGCDISQLLIDQAILRDISAERVKVMDAAKMDYPDLAFDYLFSIGSLEHFTTDGITSVLSGCSRICSGVSFHLVPISRSRRDEGWVTSRQSYWSNSQEWWTAHFAKAYREQPWIMTSRWEDNRSKGAWFICANSDRFD